MESKHMQKKVKKKASLFTVVLTDILLVGLVLCSFSLFHHVLPAMKANAIKADKPAVTAAPLPTAVPETPAPAEQGITVAAETPAPPEVTATPEPTPEPTPDTRTEWQIKFADQFTPEIVRTENSYSSPNVSVTIDTVVTGEGAERIVYYVADIYVASLDNFVTVTANDELAYFSTEDVLSMDRRSDAIMAASGDFYSYQSTGFLVRNSVVYKQDYTYCAICVLYKDGTMECIPSGSYKMEEMLAREPYQVWNFGPTLLDSEGKALSNFNVNATIQYVNPRSAIGYYEPGHYCLVVVDGRQDGWSKGMTLPELARVFEGLGCTTAYNLDGGGSAVMTFNHEKFSHQSNGAGRDLSDLIVVRETPGYTGNGEG